MSKKWINIALEIARIVVALLAGLAGGQVSL